MKLKKNPNKDLNRYRSLYFLAGLAMVMLLAFIALEWKTYDTADTYAYAINVPDESIDEVAPIHLKTPPPPKPVIPDVIEIAPDEPDVIETVIETTEPEEDKVYDVPDIIVEKINEDPLVNFMVIEAVPVFPGCENQKDKRACFQKMMNKHIVKNFKYPQTEQDLGIQGKVNIMFEIQKDGTIGNVQMRGPNKNLEKEAARIIDKLPKMTPGKQRGIPVRVPFSIPITFKLQ